MLTPQKKVFAGWSLTPRRENQKSPAINSNSNPRIADGYENGGTAAGEERDLEDLGAKVARLENELFEYQYNMGLLLIEKKELGSKYEDLQQVLEESKEALKREQTAHLIAVSDVEKREENLRKALGVEKQCVLDLEKALREMRSEYAEIKFTADSKLAEANALAASIEEKSLEVEGKLHAADAKFAEASRKSSEIDRKRQDLEGRESALRRERLSFNSERDAHEASLSKQREDLLEWERKLQEGEERLCEARRILNQREERVNEIDRSFKQKESELEEAQKKIDKANMELKKKDEDVSQRLANLTVKEKEADLMKQRIEGKEKKLLEREKELDEREKNEIQKLLDKHKAELDAKKQEFEFEMDQKRRSLDEELKSKVVELEKREIELNHIEEKITKREQALEKKLEKCKEKENDVESKSKVLKEKEKCLRDEKKQVEKEKKQMLIDTEELQKLKEELEQNRAANEEELHKIQQMKEELQVTEAERSEYSRLQSELRRELDEGRSQKEAVLREAAELKQDRMSFEKEWEVLDEKRAEVERELKKIEEEKEKWEKWRRLEEDRLRNESLAAQKKIESELEALKLEKDSFVAFMEHEKSLLSEREQTERRRMLDDLEQQRRDLEIEMQKKFEEKEKNLLEREKLFLEKTESEQNNINYLREVAERGMADMKEEQRRVEKQAEEVAANRKELEGRRVEIQKDIDELVVLSSKLKDQREELVKERERFIAFVERLKTCEQCGEMTREFMLSDLQYIRDMERREILQIPKLAEEYMRNSFKESLHPSGQQNAETSPVARNTETPRSGKSVSWLMRKCAEKIRILSPIKRDEEDSLEHPTEETSLVPQDARAGAPDSDRHDIVEEVRELSNRVVDDSFDVQRAQTDDSVRELEGCQDLSVGGWGNTYSGKEPETSQNSDMNDQSRPGKKSRPIRTRTMKAVVKEAKNILGDLAEQNDRENLKGDDESQGVSGIADKENGKKGKKRGRAYTSQTTASEHGDGESEGRSDSIVAGGPRTRRQKTAAAAQGPVEKRYNLRGSRNLAKAVAVKTSSTSRRVKAGVDGRRETLEGNSGPLPSHSAGVASDNGGSVNLMQAEIEEEGMEYSTPVPKRAIERSMLSEEVSGTPERNGSQGEHSVGEKEDDDDEEEEEDEEEVEHPGEASIGKKLWKFLTT